MDFRIPKYIEAAPGKPIQLREKHGKDFVHGLSIPFTMNVPIEFLARQAISSSTAEEKEIAEKIKALFFDDNKQVVPLGVSTLSLDREYSGETKYKIYISFSPLRDHDDAQAFIADKITVSAAKPLQGQAFELSFSVVVHPSSEEDVGWLNKRCCESKECYLKFEQYQVDLVDQSRDDEKVTPIGKGKTG